MPIKHPTLDDLARIADHYRLHPTDSDLASFQPLMAPTLLSYARLDELPEPTLPVTIHAALGIGHSLPIIRLGPGIGAVTLPERQVGYWQEKP